MQIKCPMCGEMCETDESPDVGQHVLCPFCNGKFSYHGEDVLRPKPLLDSMTRRAHRFCRECGNEISHQAVVCPRCGVPVEGKMFDAANGQVPNHMVEAIIVTVCCCVIGIVAIVYASQVNTKLAQGDIVGAQAASKAAYGWVIASACIGVIGLLWLVGLLAAVS